jgi:hypothetical protein
MPRKKFPANIIGPQVRKARYQLGLSQEELAARCQLADLDISRSTLAQIEIRIVCFRRGAFGACLCFEGGHRRFVPRRTEETIGCQTFKTKPLKITVVAALSCGALHARNIGMMGFETLSARFYRFRFWRALRRSGDAGSVFSVRQATDRVHDLCPRPGTLQR